MHDCNAQLLREGRAPNALEHHVDPVELFPLPRGVALESFDGAPEPSHGAGDGRQPRDDGNDRDDAGVDQKSRLPTTA
jgi:hypothetical protein